MRNCCKRFAALILVICLAAVWVPVTGRADPANVRRISGENRFETAFQVAEALRGPGSDNKFNAIVIASGLNFADALSGSYLAAMRGAPILLSYNDVYNARVQEYIRANLKDDGTVYILGGPAAVPESMEAGLEGYTIKRLAGENRFETNLAILREAGVEGKEILVCTGTNFADSLSASAVGLPILLVWSESGTLSRSQTEFLAEVENGGFCVIGGENAVGSMIESQLAEFGETERLAGADRFETSVMVAQRYFENPPKAILAYAWNYPDGLCGGPFAYAHDYPLILSMTCYEHAAMAYMEEHNIHLGYVLGGEKLLDDWTVEIIFGQNNEPGHYMECEVTHPTCKTAGFETHTCSRCGYHYKSGNLEKWPHVYQDVKRVEPTCTQEGSALYRCKWCDKSYTVTLEPLGHMYRTLTILGVGTSYSCGNCDYYVDTGEDPGIVCRHSGISTTGTSHVWDEWLTVAEPTEENEGRLERKCVYCDQTQEKVLPKLKPGHVHKWKVETVLSGCEKQGYTMYSCTGCGVSYKMRTTNTLGHDVDWVTVKEATADTAGRDEGDCRRCGSHERDFIYTQEYMASHCDNHDMFLWIAGKGNCTMPATNYYYCNGCYMGYEEVVGDYDPDNHTLKLLYADEKYQYCWCIACGCDKVLPVGVNIDE